MRTPDDPRVRAAFAAVDRRGFLTTTQRRRARADRPISIGHGQTNSQPTTVANMLELLEVQPGQRVLDLGSGSGWTTALLGHLVGPTGRVVGVELVPELAAWGAGNLRRHDLPWTSIETADPGVLGKPAAGPYDRILVSAGAAELPAALIEQLAPGGRMVIPVRGEMLVVDQTEHGPTSSTHGRYAFVPLIVSRPLN